MQLFGKGSAGAGPHDDNDQGGKEEDLLSTEGFDDPAEQRAPEGGLAEDVEGDLIVEHAGDGGLMKEERGVIAAVVVVDGT